MATSLRLLALLFSVVLIGATWDTNQPSTPVWDVGLKVKWDASTGVYESPDLDTPDPGWYRSVAEYLVPDTWPEYAVSNFLSFGLDPLPHKWETMKVWDRDSLTTNTYWADATADKVKGYISVDIPVYKFFTYVSIEPDDGVVDQDFQGKAKIYNLAEDKRYRIFAWDAEKLLGQTVTGISDKYIHLLGEYQGTPVAQKVVEDPNKRLWVSAFEPSGYGLAYYHTALYTVTTEGEVEKRVSLPITQTYVNNWWTDLVLEENEDATVSTCEMIGPLLARANAQSYIAKIDRSGSTKWQHSTSDVSVMAIARLSTTTGYVCAGLDGEGGLIYRLDDTGNGGVWGSSNLFMPAGDTGTSIFHTGTINPDIIIENPDFKVTTGGTIYSTNNVSDGETDCGTSPSGGSCSNAFDANDTTYAEDMATCSDFGYVWVDLQSPKDIRRVRVKWDVFQFGNYFGHNWAYLSYSDDGSTWSSDTYINGGITDFTGWYYFDDTVDIASLGAHRYWRVKFVLHCNVSPGDSYYRVYTITLWDISGSSVILNPTCFYAAGLMGSIAYSDLVDSVGGSASGTADDTANAFDNNPSTAASIENGETINWTFGSAQTVTFIHVTHLQGSGTFHFEGLSGGAWVTLSSQTFSGWSAGDRYLYVSSPISVTQYRLRLESLPSIWSVYEIELFGTGTGISGDAVITKFYATPAVASGSTLWQTAFDGADCPVSGYFLSLTQSKRTGDIVAAGYNVADNSDLSNNKAYIACVDHVTGASKWQKLYPQMSIAYGISATDDGGYLVAGTLYTGTEAEDRSAVLMKIDANGNVDGKFPQVFKDPTTVGADGRDVISTRDGGILMVGGYQADADKGRAALIKLDRFYRPCSSGIPCE